MDSGLAPRLQGLDRSLAILEHHVCHQAFKAVHELRSCALGCSGAEGWVGSVLNDELRELPGCLTKGVRGDPQRSLETADPRAGGVEVAVDYDSRSFGDDFARSDF